MVLRRRARLRQPVPSSQPHQARPHEADHAQGLGGCGLDEGRGHGCDRTQGHPPPDYELFGRSFDGLDMRFMKPLREKRPDDFAVVKKWYPFIEADEKRWEHYGL